MNAPLRVLCILSLTALLATPATAEVAYYSTYYSPAAGVCCGDGQTYRIVYQTVYEQHQATAYRLEYETVCEERQVTTYKPVWETQVRENRYKVGKQIYETAEREEAYTVSRPIYETEYRDASYNRVRIVQETAEREEAYTVSRPVYETAEREECYTVARPVYETTYRTEYQTVMQPVTTCRTEYVDQGRYVEQTVLKPGLPATKLAWQPAACVTNPVTGAVYQQPAGLYWQQSPAGRYEV
jgi:hypothetical protein